jgi:hypothetical protein
MLDSPSLWKMYSDWSEDYLNFLESLFQRGIESGEFVPHSAFSNALAFMGALDGIIFHLIMNKNLKPESVIAIFQEKFIRNVEIKKTSGKEKKQGV